jgi:hypothetical protein
MRLRFSQSQFALLQYVPRPAFWVATLSLFALLLSACASAAMPAESPSQATQPAGASLPTVTSAPALEPGTQPASGEATALPVATSRGPNLEATDPTTVSLASGGLQFVEFFRFT